MVEFKINSYEDRRSLVAILASAGYTVKIVEKEDKDHCFHKDCFVQVMEVEGVEKPTIINNYTVSGNCDCNQEQLAYYLHKKYGV